MPGIHSGICRPALDWSYTNRYWARLRMYVSDMCQTYKVCNSKLHAGKVSSALSLLMQIMYHKNLESRK
eukprot:scaffold163551_cov17-Prasinocladus_malaysianus.AAC.1